MAKIVRLAARPPSAERVDALAVQLIRLELASSPDGPTMDAIREAELRFVAALAKAESHDLAEIAQKVTAVARRAAAADGFLDEGELDLLRSALADMTRVETTAVAFA
jgi:hypothetical protein